jgi:ankyrin repeat protein
MTLRRVLVFSFTLLISIAVVGDLNNPVRAIRKPLEPHLQQMLDIAAERGATGRMRLLILVGANVNGKVYSQFVCGNASREDIARDHHYPLISAAGAGENDAVELLLNNGADVNAVDGFGRTALWHVALGGHADTARLLISRGANVNAPNGNYSRGTTPLEKAIEEEEQDVVEVLLANGARQ